MYKVLLVEDNEMNRDMLSRRLTRKGYTVVCAVNGKEGITLAVTEQPDIILMDLSLPIMDGWEATAYLKNDEQCNHIPIIVLTAHAMTGDSKRAYEAGCDDFDTKPVNLERLLQKMTTLLNK